MPNEAGNAPKTYTACILIIGNEILSGRVQDANVAFLAKELNEVGVRLKEVRVIPDESNTIDVTVNEVRRAFDYVFTTGGIIRQARSTRRGCVWPICPTVRCSCPTRSRARQAFRWAMSM